MPTVVSHFCFKTTVHMLGDAKNSTLAATVILLVVYRLWNTIIECILVWNCCCVNESITFLKLPLPLHQVCCGNLWSVTTHTHLTALFPGLPRWAGTRKIKPIWIWLKQETVGGSGISWGICKSAPRSRQITTPAPHHSRSMTSVKYIVFWPLWSQSRTYQSFTDWQVGWMMMLVVLLRVII